MGSQSLRKFARWRVATSRRSKELANNPETFMDKAKKGDVDAILKLNDFAKNGNEKAKDALEKLYWDGKNLTRSERLLFVTVWLLSVNRHLTVVRWFDWNRLVRIIGGYQWWTNMIRTIFPSDLRPRAKTRHANESGRNTGFFSRYIRMSFSQCIKIIAEYLSQTKINA